MKRVKEIKQIGNYIHEGDLEVSGNIEITGILKVDGELHCHNLQAWSVLIGKDITVNEIDVNLNLVSSRGKIIADKGIYAGGDIKGYQGIQAMRLEGKGIRSHCGDIITTLDIAAFREVCAEKSIISKEAIRAKEIIAGENIHANYIEAEDSIFAKGDISTKKHIKAGDLISVKNIKAGSVFCTKYNVKFETIETKYVPNRREYYAGLTIFSRWIKDVINSKYINMEYLEFVPDADKEKIINSEQLHPLDRAQFMMYFGLKKKMTYKEVFGELKGKNNESI